MYWRLGTNIETAAMDGTQRRVLVIEVGDSYGLTIDPKGLCYTDNFCLLYFFIVMYVIECVTHFIMI